MSLHIWLQTVEFAAFILLIALHALSASGQFPKEHRTASLADRFGSLVLFGSIFVTLICLVVAVFIASKTLPWYAAIIGGGISLLVAPLVLQSFPDKFVDGRSSLLTFSTAALLVLFAMWACG